MSLPISPVDNTDLCIQRAGCSLLLPRKELTETEVHKPGSRVAWLHCQNIQIIKKRKPFLSAFNNTWPQRTHTAYSSATQCEPGRGALTGRGSSPSAFPPAPPSTTSHTHTVNSVQENLEPDRAQGTILCIMQQCNIAETRPLGKKKSPISLRRDAICRLLFRS